MLFTVVLGIGGTLVVYAIASMIGSDILHAETWGDESWYYGPQSLFIALALFGILPTDIVTIRVVNMMMVFTVASIVPLRLLTAYKSWFVERHIFRYWQHKRQ